MVILHVYAGVWFLWSKKIIMFQKEKGNIFTLLITFIVKSLQKEQNSTNLLLWPPICRNKPQSDSTPWTLTLVIVVTSSSNITFGAKFNFAQIRGDKSMDNSRIILTWRFVKNSIHIRHKDGQISSNLNCNPGCQAIVVLKWKNRESFKFVPFQKSR